MNPCSRYPRSWKKRQTYLYAPPLLRFSVPVTSTVFPSADVQECAFGK